MVQARGSQLDIQPQTSRRWSKLAELQGQARKHEGLARVSYLIRLGGHTTTTYDISGLGARAGSTPPAS